MQSAAVTLGPEKRIKTQLYDFEKKYCTQGVKEVSKQTGFLHSLVCFFRSTVFNKGDRLSVCAEGEREGEGGEREREREERERGGGTVRDRQ